MSDTKTILTGAGILLVGVFAGAATMYMGMANGRSSTNTPAPREARVVYPVTPPSFFSEDGDIPPPPAYPPPAPYPLAPPQEEVHVSPGARATIPQPTRRAARGMQKGAGGAAP